MARKQSPELGAARPAVKHCILRGPSSSPDVEGGHELGAGGLGEGEGGALSSGLTNNDSQREKWASGMEVDVPMDHFVKIRWRR